MEISLHKQIDFWDCDWEDKRKKKKRKERMKNDGRNALMAVENPRPPHQLQVKLLGL